MSSVAEAVLEDESIMRSIMAVCLGALLGLLCSVLLENSFLLLWTSMLFSCIVAGYISKLLPRVASKVMSTFLAMIGWRLDVVSVWNRLPGPKLVLYHKEDGVLPFKRVSLYNALAVNALATTRVMELKLVDETENGAYCHCYSLDTDAVEWQAVVSHAKSMLNIQD